MFRASSRPERLPRARRLALSWSTGLIVLALAVEASGAQQESAPIRFAKGSHSAEVRGSLLRGEVRRYSLNARAGQRMHVRIGSVEKNAVFQLYRPRSGAALPGAEEGKDAQSWSGALPVDGTYLLVVGSTRGNASYTLLVSIR
jgi:hypothetical protein